MMHLEPPLNAPIERLCGVPTPTGAVVLASSEMISGAIQTLAKRIQPWIDLSPEDPVVIVGLLNGGKYFADRLVTELQGICTSHFDRNDIRVSTRDGDGRALAAPQIAGDIESLRKRRVLVVDDILDSGVTLTLTQQALNGLVAQLRTTVLVEKLDPRSVEHAIRPEADFVGLSFVDARWFSGCGMDMPGDPQGNVRESTMIIAYPPVF